MRKLCKSTHESLRRPDSRQESYAQQLEEMTGLHDRLAENGIEFARALHQMYDDLTEMANNMERGRKQWKQFGLSSERKAHDAEQMVEKVGVMPQFGLPMAYRFTFGRQKLDTIAAPRNSIG
jgi:hypothetical protein